MIREAFDQASTAIACDSSMSSDSHVNPSPMANQSTPSWRAIFSSPTFQSPDFRNCTTATRHPRASARIMVPKAAVDFPLPSPVLTITRDGARRVAAGGGSVGGSWPGSVIRPRSRVNEAERMAGRVYVHPPGGTRLMLRLASAELQHLLLGGLDVIDHEIQVRLLRMLGFRPARRPVAGCQLVCDRHAAVRLQLDPVSVIERLVDYPASDGRVELGETHRIGRVEGDNREAGDTHEASSMADSTTGSPAATRPSSSTRAYIRDQPGCRPWCIRVKSPSMNQAAFL